MITNYTIALDKLELMLCYNTYVSGFNLATIGTHNALDTYTVGSVNLFRSHTVTGNYKLQYDINVGDLRLGFIKLLPTKPLSLVNGEPLVKLSFSNRLLYAPTKVIPLLNTFLSTFNLEINNITRYEIALDSNVNSNDLLLNNFYDNDLHFMNKNRKINNILKVSTLYRNGDETASFYVGHRKSVQVAFYNKSKQSDLKKIYKDYQKQFHESNGLDTTKDVFRVEVRVPRKVLKASKTVYKHHLNQSILTIARYNKLNDTEKELYQKTAINRNREVTVEKLFDPVEMLSLFKLDFENIIDFRYKDYANKDRCTKIKLIDFKQVKEYKYTITMTDIQGVNTNLIKKQIKNLLELYKYGKDILYWNNAKELSYNNELHPYFQQVQAKLRISTPMPVVKLNNSVSLF
jgi:hypothetical protein